MNDFYQLIYNYAAESNTLGLDSDRECLIASQSLDSLVESLLPDPALRDKLTDAIDRLVYRSNVLSLSFGFRLAVQVIRPVDPVYPTRAWTVPRSCSASPSPGGPGAG